VCISSTLQDSTYRTDESSIVVVPRASFGVEPNIEAKDDGKQSEARKSCADGDQPWCVRDGVGVVKVMYPTHDGQSGCVAGSKDPVHVSLLATLAAVRKTSHIAPVGRGYEGGIYRNMFLSHGHSTAAAQMPQDMRPCPASPAVEPYH
jgi:hypothetical protein